MFPNEQTFVIHQPGWTVDSTKDPITAVNYCQEGTVIAYARGPNFVKVISSADASEKRNITQDYSQQPIINTLFQTSEKTNLLFGTKDGHIFLHDLKKDQRKFMTRHVGGLLVDLASGAWGDDFAYAVNDGSIRIFDFETFEKKTMLVQGVFKTKLNINNNIQGILYNPDDSNMIFSAVQADKINIWDVRTGMIQRSISGPHLRGSSMDMYDGKLITGSFREKNQIEVWDVGSSTKVYDIQMTKPINVTSLSVARNGLHLIAGGILPNMAQIFEFETGRFVGETAAFKSAVNKAIMSPFGASFAVGTDGGLLFNQYIRLKPIPFY